jgi:hypothetical protein
MIRDIIETGMQAGRDKWPRGLWFHRHGFGAYNHKMWRRLMSTLMADGLELKSASKNLHAAQFNNAAIQILRRQNSYHAQATASLFKDVERWDRWVKVY